MGLFWNIRFYGKEHADFWLIDGWRDWKRPNLISLVITLLTKKCRTSKPLANFAN